MGTDEIRHMLQMLPLVDSGLVIIGLIGLLGLALQRIVEIIKYIDKKDGE